LWNEGSQEGSSDIAKQIERVTAGEDRHWDHQLAACDVLGSIAHVCMLAGGNIIQRNEADILLAELDKLLVLAKKGELLIEDGVEDIHSQVELMLTRKLGDIGKKVHAARSRNDQVLVDMKLFLRQELLSLEDEVQTLSSLLL